MEIVSLLGSVLAEEMRISKDLAIQLFITALQDKFGSNMDLKDLKYEDYKNVVKHSLMERLEDLNPRFSANIQRKLERALIDYQSIILMSKV
jgi:hypothetical protein